MMKYKSLQIDNLPANIQYSVYDIPGKTKEYHLMINPQNPLLDLSAQIDICEKVMEKFSSLVSGTPTLIWKRYFMSDPVNQVQEVKERSSQGMISFIGQAPLNYSKVAVWAYFIEDVQVSHEDDGAVMVRHADYKHYYYLGLNTTSSKGEYGQTWGMFTGIRDKLLARNMSVAANLLRTWIYVQGVDTRYAGMVKARKELFIEEGLDETTHYIASTGIEGRHIHPETLVFMDAYAIDGLKKEQVTFLQAKEYLSPTNKYGVTFERGVAIEYGDRKHIYISGTASIDKEGEIVFPHDIVAQTRRTLTNISALLTEGGAEFSDIAQLLVYLRDTADYPLVRNIISEELSDIPVICVLAPVCRPGWLIEIECIAICANQNDKFSSF